MAGLAEKFTRLKRCVGGNREITSYEETFGQPVDEQLHVTPPSLWQRRILSELGFALTLDGGFESQIESAMDFCSRKLTAAALSPTATAWRPRRFLSR